MIDLTPVILHLLLAASPTPIAGSGPGLSDDVSVGLQPVWKTALGAAYSRITISTDDVVTQYSDGQTDYVVGLSASDGSVRWRHALGQPNHPPRFSLTSKSNKGHLYAF